MNHIHSTLLQHINVNYMNVYVNAHMHKYYVGWVYSQKSGQAVFSIGLNKAVYNSHSLLSCGFKVLLTVSMNCTILLVNN